MTTRRGTGIEMLRYDSEAYQSHKDEIAVCKETAERLGLLTGRFRDQILLANGIVCDRSREDKKQSVSQQYFYWARRIDNARSREEMTEHLEEIRLLLFDVLGMHMGMQTWQKMREREDESTDFGGPTNMYSDIAKEIDDHCVQNELPSLTPNLFNAASLGKQIERSGFDWNDPHVQELVEKLTHLVSWQDHHLHATVTGIARSGQHQMSLQMIQGAAELREEPVEDLYKANALLAPTAMESHFALKQYDEAIHIAERRGVECILDNPSITQYYLRSLIDGTRIEEAYEFLGKHHEKLARERSLGKTVGIACEAIGWYLYGLGRNEEAIELLEAIVPNEIRPNDQGGRENMHCLYTTLQNTDEEG